MKTLAFILAVLALAACSPEIVPAITDTVPTVSPVPTAQVLAVPAVPTVVPAKVLAIVGDVYIRNEPDGSVIGNLRRGDVVMGECVGNWCKIEGGYIWRGCTDDNPDRKRCEAR